jgi:hypothetical protein
MTDVSENDIKEEIPPEFRNLMNDFMGDILTSFPEYASTIETYSMLDNKETILYLFHHCKKVYPSRFFDILYNNNEIFSDESIDTEFLPNIDFSKLWKEKLTEKTRNIIWKYLQLILFCIIQNVNDASHFGNSEKLFEAINEEEFKKKIEESMADIGQFFEENDKMFNNTGDLSGNEFNIPDSEKIHEHINGLLKGKLGSLASEIAEETASELDFDISNNADVNDVFSKLFKNPTKLMKMVKSIGSKIDDKIKSGEIDQNELMKEASELMKNMKNMPGMKNMEKMFKSMNMPTGGKMNVGAMQQKLNMNMKKMNQKDRMLKKLQKRKESKKKDNSFIQRLKTHEEIQQEVEAIFKTFSTENETTQVNKTKKKNKKKKNKKKKKTN